MKDSGLYKDAFDLLPVPALIADPAGKILVMNKEFRDSSGELRRYKTLSELGITLPKMQNEPVSGQVHLENHTFVYNLKALPGEQNVLITFTKSVTNPDLLRHQIHLAMTRANAGLYIADLEKGETEWDAKAAAMIGITINNGRIVKKEDFFEVIHPEDRQRIVSALHQTKSDLLKNTFRIITRQNETRYVNSLGCVLRDKHGNAQKLIGVNFDVTERIGIGRLKESEERYRLLFESIPYAIWRATPDGKVEYLNQNGLKLIGRSRADILKIPWHTLVHKNDLPLVREKWRKSVENKEDYFNHMRIRMQDGSYQWFSVAACPKFDADGNVSFWAGICVNIQDTKEYEERLNLALESGNQGIYDWNLVTNEVTLNHVFYRITGYEPHELSVDAAQLFDEIVHPDDLPSIHEYAGMFQSNKTDALEFEYRCLTKDAGYRWMHARSKVVEWDDKGFPKRIMGTQMDIDRSKRLELKLVATNTHLKNIIRNVPGAVFRAKLSDIEQVNFLNDQILHLTGYTASEFYPTGKILFFDLIQPYERETLKKMISDTAKSGSVFEITFRLRDKAGDEKWIWVKAGHVSIGNEPYTEGIMTDITDKIRTEDRIISATIEAEDAERRRISGEIHDSVQQVLISSMLSLQSIEGRVLSSGDAKIIEEYRKGMKMLQEGVDETRQIAESIMPVAIQEFGLVQTLENTIGLLNNRHIMDFTFYDNLEGLRLDPRIETSLYRICQEAIRNALKYSEATEINLQLIRHSDSVVLSIEDNGKGFDMKQTSILFTGLGISYMKSRANSISGNLEISSSPGRGTTIIVEVPFTSG